MPNKEGNRLYDRICVQGITIPRIPPEIAFSITNPLMKQLREAHVFDIQNVADYFFLHSTKDLSEWSKSDFPNAAPPFPSVFMEFEVRANYTQGGDRPYAAGILNLAIDSQRTNRNISMFNKEIPEARWLVESSLILEQEKWTSPYAVAHVTSAILPNGEIYSHRDGNDVSFGFFQDIFLPDSQKAINNQSMRDDIDNLAAYVYNPSLLALSFMHCKGVERVLQTPPQKLSRAFEKRRGQPLHKYHILDIKPMQDVLKREGNVEEDGLKKALSLHIVRGHFADYREKGLFGKNFGLYWRPQHHRGSISVGITDKDYRIREPQAPPPAQ